MTSGRATSARAVEPAVFKLIFARKAPRNLAFKRREFMSHRQRVNYREVSVQRVDSSERSSPVMLALPRIRPDDPAGQVVCSTIRQALSRIAATEAQVRQGEVEGVHRLRTTTRRLRSELRTLKSFVELHWREHLEEELKWLARRLGDVRDMDILLARLKKAAAKTEEGDASESALEPMFAKFQSRRSQAAWSLSEAMHCDRYRSLLAALEQAGLEPPLADAAAEPCRTALPPAAWSTWRRLKKGARSLRPADPDQEFHNVRKKAKRARYTAELIAPIIGDGAAKSSDRFIRLVTKVQDVLGDHQDAVVAAHEIEVALAEYADHPGFVPAAQALLEWEHDKAQAARAAFLKVWDKLDRKKSRRWLKIRRSARLGA
jgi:CHAD domain-containing protein